MANLRTNFPAAVVLVAVLSLLATAAVGFELFTVGKNKSAKMSTRHSVDGGDPMLGNDGSLAGSPGASVLHTDSGDPLPWWLVDMQRPYAIFGARIWNRLDGPTAQRFTQISFGITDNPSVWTTFNKDLFDLCFYYTDVPTAADNPINITCRRPIVGRYLTVYKNITGFSGSSVYLHFVEIDILAMTKGSSFPVTETQPSFSASSDSLLTEWSGQKRSQLDCLIHCSLQPRCMFALFKPDSRYCWLFESARIPDSFIGIVGSGGAKFLTVYG